MIFILISYFLLFLFLAWKNFRLAVILFIIFLPTYLIRFEVWSLPLTALELSFGALFLIWLVKYSHQDWKQIVGTFAKHKVFFGAAVLFFAASVVSIFVSDMPIPSLGEWRAYFLEPMILFLVLIGHRDIIKAGDLIWALAFSTLSISAYSVVQEFTGWGIATPEWANESARRVTAFFSSPNAVGLYLAPVSMLIFFVIINKKSKSHDVRFWGLVVTTILSLMAIIFTKSQGTWIGLAAGMLTFLFFATAMRRGPAVAVVGYKKIVMLVVILGIIFSLVTPSMRQAILFQDQANQNRLRLWGYTWTFLSQSPQNFILGTGVRQFFRKVQKPYYDKQIMERLIYPHNIFLNFWTETGLLGMLGAVTILGYVFYLSNKVRKNHKLIGAGLLGALTVLVVHGLVDVPYFKNDLAFLFWIIMAAVFIVYENIYQGQANGV